MAGLLVVRSSSLSLESDSFMRREKFIATRLDSQLLTGKVIIQAAVGHQLIMCSNLSDAAFLQDHNAMRFTDRAQTMRDHNRRAASH